MQDGLFRYPFRGPGGVETLLIGGGLHLLAVYLPVVPYVPVVGYLLSVIVHTARDADAGRRGAPRFVRFPPTRTGVRRLAADGLRGSLVTVGFLTPAAVVAAVTARGIGSVDATLADLSSGAGAAILLGGTATLLVVFAFCYPLPAALAAVGRRRRLRAALDRDLLGRAATDARYFVGWTAGVTVLALGVAVALPLSSVAVGFFVAFYAQVVAAASWGWGLSRVLE